MRVKKIRLAIITAFVLTTVSHPSLYMSAGDLTSLRPGQLMRSPQSKWTALSSSVKGDEFSILMPVSPSPYVTERGSYLEKNNTVIDKARTFTAYADKILYVIEVYDTPNPKKALESLLDYSYIAKDEKRNVTVGGFKGKQVLYDGGDYYKNIQYLPTKRRVYVIGVATRDKSNPAVNQFLSSLKLGSVSSASDDSGDLMLGDATPTASLTTAPSVANDDVVVNGKEVTRKIVTVMRREPNLIGGANKRGTVILQSLFSSSGYVTDVKVVKGLDARLDQAAIDAAKYVKFIPAEKDGQPVSQYLQVEFNFH